MLSNGWTKSNTHFGNTKIIAGSIDVDGVVRIGDQSVTGDGYVLPSVKGTEGQVLTMNADKTTSFQDSASGGTTTLIGSAELNTIVVGGGITGQGLIPSFQGTRDLNINDFSVGGSYVIEAQGPIQYLYDGTSPSVVNSFRIKLNTILTGASNYNLEIDNFVDGTISDGTVQDSSYYSFWRYRAVITKTTTNQVHISTKAEMSKFSNPQDYRSFNQAPNIFAPQVINFTLDPTLTLSFTLQCDNLLGAGANCTFINPSIIWFVAQLGQVNPPQLLTNDHTQLTNLNIGDAGHTQFALLQGRDNGQILSGGILPFHNLTLKAHNIGLPNIVVRDINTRFDKNIDLNNNSIENVNDINNNLIQFNSVGNSVKINSNPTENINITADADLLLKSTNSFLDIDSNIIRIISTGTPQAQIEAVNGIEFYNNLNMSTNNILNAGQIGCDKVDGANGFLDFNATAGTPPITIPAMELKTTAGSRLNIQADTESINIIGTTITNRTDIQQFIDSGNNALLTLTPLQIDVSKNIIMNNNNINSSNFIYANRIIVPDYETTTGFMTFFGLGSYTPSFTGSGLDMNLGNINNVDTIENTGNNNITLPIQLGVPSGALQVKNGGAYIKQDLQVDGTIYCNTVNGIRPSGGLYSESSGFNIPSTNLTETNLLGQGGSAGSLAVPAGGFSQYDSYSFKASGVLTGGTNDLFTLRLKSLVGGTTPVELGSIVVTLTDNGLVDVAWKVEADFNVRTLGGAGVGVVVLSGNFAYTNNNDVVKTYLRTIVNSSVFDTTQSNELQFTFQNDATNPLTNIRIDQASFTKWY